MHRRGKICKQLLDDLKETTGYYNLKEEAPALCGEVALEEAVACRKRDYT